MEQKNTADFVIIGGGVIGCSTAYNLANQGAKNVVLLDKGEICSGGTAKSCAITRSHYTIEANMQHDRLRYYNLATLQHGTSRLSTLVR